MRSWGSLRTVMVLAALVSLAPGWLPARAELPADPAAIEECRRIPGRPLETQGERLVTLAPSGDFAVVLPGPGWCEVQFREMMAPVYLNVAPLAGMRRTRQVLRAEETPFVLALVHPAIFPAAGPYPTPESLLAAIREHHRTGAADPVLRGYAEMVHGLRSLSGSAGLSRLELDLPEGTPRCVRVRGGGTAGRPPRGDTRRFALELRLCFAQPGTEAAAMIALLRGVPAGERALAAELDALATAFFGSLEFPAESGVSATCEVVQRHFARLLPDCAARVGVRAEPGLPNAMEVAMGCLAGSLQGSDLGPLTRQRCHAEVLRAAGFRDALPLEMLERLRRRWEHERRPPADTPSRP